MCEKVGEPNHSPYCSSTSATTGPLQGTIKIERLYCSQRWHICSGRQENSIWGSHHTYYGMFRGETKGRKREGSRWLGMSKHEWEEGWAMCEQVAGQYACLVVQTLLPVLNFFSKSSFPGDGNLFWKHKSLSSCNWGIFGSRSQRVPAVNKRGGEHLQVRVWPQGTPNWTSPWACRVSWGLGLYMGTFDQVVQDNCQWHHGAWKLTVCMCTCACVYVCAPAAGVELWPQGLVCLCASNWKDWDPGAAAQQTECLNLTAGGIHTVHLCKYISQKRIFSSPSGEPERKQNEALLVWMMCSMWLATCASIYALYVCVFVCLLHVLDAHTQPRYILDLGMCSCSSFTASERSY